MIEEQESASSYEEEFCKELTAGQWIAYKYLISQSGILSILGSSLIIFMVLYRGRHGDGKFQDRLLLPMSVFDIIESIAWAFSTTPIPHGSSCTYGAVGNQATCVTQGFMITMGLCVPFYNAMLCIYYLLVVKYNVSDEDIAKYEPLMHIVSICPALIAAIIAAANDLFNNYIFACWIVDDKYVDIYSTSDDVVLFGLHVLISIFGVLILLTIGYCTINMYRFVKNRELTMSTYRFQRPRDGGTNAPSTENSRTSSRSSRLSNTAIDVKKQAFLYVGSFILTYIFSGICIAFEIFETELPYVLMLLQAIFAPLQGFWNFLAYIRLRFNAISRQHNDKGILRRLYITVFHKPEPSRQSRRRSSAARSRRRRHSV